MTVLASAPTTRFDRGAHLTAGQPPEQRGVDRDGVRLLVVSDAGVVHTRFRELADHLQPGDLIVVNTSATMPAEVDGQIDGGPVVLHAATALDDGTWVVELRRAPDAAEPILDARADAVIALPGGAQIRLQEPYPYADSSPTGAGNRLWRATVKGSALDAVLARHGRPIAYGYLNHRIPLADYQTIFARPDLDGAGRPVFGSAEMPSAARPFSGTVLAGLAARGVQLAPITLHTGVSSQEVGEGPQAERYAVPAATARLVNAARADGRRVIAVGTTVTRALESATGPDRQVRAQSGWTTLVIGPQRPVRVVSGLITGWHDALASHLLLVESVAGPELTQRAYDAAIAEQYRWHEFGDSCLLLP